MMTDMDEVLRKNPKAAKELENVREVIETLHELRRTGVAKGDTLRPVTGRRHSLTDLKARTNVRGRLKLTYGA